MGVEPRDPQCNSGQHLGTPQDCSNEPPLQSMGSLPQLPFSPSTPQGFWELQPLRRLTWVLFQAQLAGLRGRQGQRCHSSDSQKSKTAGRGSLRAADTHTDPGRGTVSKGRKAGMRWLKQVMTGPRRGALTSGPPLQDDPLSLQPPVGTSVFRRPWALIQTVPTRSLWGDRGDMSKNGKLRGAGSQGGGVGRDPERVRWRPRD